MSSYIPKWQCGASSSGDRSAGSHVHSRAPNCHERCPNHPSDPRDPVRRSCRRHRRARRHHARTCPAPSVNDTCLMCHADKDAKGAAGKSIAVDGAKFAASVHGEIKLKCTDCHADVSADKLPHADKLKPVNCANLPRQGGQGVRGNRARHRAQGRQHRRRHLHGLPRHARHPALEGPGVAHQSRQHRGDVLEVPRQRRHGAQRASCRAATSAASSTTASTARR